VERVFKKYRGQAANEDRVKELIPQLESKLDGYEAILGRQKYLAGDVRFRSIGRPGHVREMAVDADGGFSLCRRSLSRISSICPMAA
jgi:hypothetical protein